MAHIIEPWVRETTITTGTNDIALAAGFDDSMEFSDVMVSGDTCDYAIGYGPTAGLLGPREEGKGTWISGNVLQRTTVYRSRHANGTVDKTKVTFPAGVKTVIMTFSSARAAMVVNAIQQVSGGDDLLGPSASVLGTVSVMRVNETDTTYQVNITVAGDNGIQLNNSIAGASGPNLTFANVLTQKWSIQLHPELSDRLYIVDAGGNDGVYIAQNATSWTANSDRRLKQDIATVDVLKRLRSGPYRAVTYRLKANPDQLQVGVIAQEVAECFPELVTGTNDGKPEVDRASAMGTNYDRHGPMALYGLKQLLIEVDGLKQKVKMLEREMIKGRKK